MREGREHGGKGGDCSGGEFVDDAKDFEDLQVGGERVLDEVVCDVSVCVLVLLLGQLVVSGQLFSQSYWSHWNVAIRLDLTEVKSGMVG